MRYVDGKPHTHRHRRAVDAARARDDRTARRSCRRSRDRGDHQAGAAEGTDQGRHQVPGQPDRPFRHRRSARRLRPDRPQDHRRHLRRRVRRTAAARSRARIRPRSTARPPTRRVTSRRTSSRPAWRAVPDPGVVRDRRGAADQVMVNTVRHGPRVGRQDRGARARAFRPASEGHHPDARPAASDLREDRGVRPLRPRRAGIHVGRHGQGRGACGPRPACKAPTAT